MFGPSYEKIRADLIALEERQRARTSGTREHTPPHANLKPTPYVETKMATKYLFREVTDSDGNVHVFLRKRRIVAPDASEVPPPPAEWIQEEKPKVACPHCNEMFINVNEHITKIHKQTNGYIIDVVNDDSEEDLVKCIIYDDGKKIGEVPAHWCGSDGGTHAMYEFMNDDMNKLFPQKKRSYDPELGCAQEDVYVAFMYLPFKRTGKGQLIKIVSYDSGGYNAEVKTYKGKRITVIDSTTNHE